jgi:hypothetical protein
MLMLRISKTIGKKIAGAVKRQRMVYIPRNVNAQSISAGILASVIPMHSQVISVDRLMTRPTDLAGTCY